MPLLVSSVLTKQGPCKPRGMGSTAMPLRSPRSSKGGGLPNGALPLAEVRARVAEALAPASDSDPEVLPDLVDAVTPPALMLIWDDPWLAPTTIGRGFWDAQIPCYALPAEVSRGQGLRP